MKKTYIIPELRVELMQTEGLIALSLQSGTANESDALVKEGDDDWNIWGDEKEE